MFQRRDSEISLECLVFFYREKSRILQCIKIHGCKCYCFCTHRDIKMCFQNSTAFQKIDFFLFFLYPQEALQLYYHLSGKVRENNTVHRINPIRLQHRSHKNILWQKLSITKCHACQKGESRNHLL